MVQKGQVLEVVLMANDYYREKIMQKRTTKAYFMGLKAKVGSFEPGKAGTEKKKKALSFKDANYFEKL